MWKLAFSGLVLLTAVLTCVRAQGETNSFAAVAEEAPGEESAIAQADTEWPGDAPWVYKESPIWSRETVVRRAVRLGRPLLPSAAEGGGAEVDNKPSLQISTEFLGRLHLNPLKGGAVARSRLEMDQATGLIGLQKLEMGFEGQRLWLIHTPSTDETEGAVGVELKLRW